MSQDTLNKLKTIAEKLSEINKKIEKSVELSKTKPDKKQHLELAKQYYESEKKKLLDDSQIAIKEASRIRDEKHEESERLKKEQMQLEGLLLVEESFSSDSQEVAELGTKLKEISKKAEESSTFVKNIEEIIKLVKVSGGREACPKCGSPNISSEPVSSYGELTAVMQTCSECNHTWRKGA